MTRARLKSRDFFDRRRLTRERRDQGPREGSDERGLRAVPFARPGGERERGGGGVVVRGGEEDPQLQLKFGIAQRRGRRVITS